MTGDREPLVSVVVPAYNEAPYIGQCIESVRSQTHANWDLAIVNNCSTDRTSEIAGQFAAGDPRIRIVENERFVPVIANHNAAFRQISPHSVYCKVIGADDRLFPECIASLVGVAERFPDAVIVGSHGAEDDKVVFDGIPDSREVFSGREICRQTLLGGPYVFGTPSTVLYRSDIVRSRSEFYNEGNLHADAEVCFEFLQGRDFGFVHRVLTYQRFREGSNTAYARSLNTYLNGQLLVLQRYGPAYLSEPELQSALRRLLGDYHWYLGEQFFARRDRDFWAYHRGKLAELGHPLTQAKLSIAVLRVAQNRIRRRAVDTVKALVHGVSGTYHGLRGKK